MTTTYRAREIEDIRRVSRTPVDWVVFDFSGEKRLGLVRAARRSNARKMAEKRFPGYGFVMLASDVPGFALAAYPHDPR